MNDRLIIQETKTLYGLDNKVLLCLIVPHDMVWQSTYVVVNPPSVLKLASRRLFVTTMIVNTGTWAKHCRMLEAPVAVFPHKWPGYADPVLQRHTAVHVVITRRERWWQRWWRLLTGTAWHVGVVIEGRRL